MPSHLRLATVARVEPAFAPPQTAAQQPLRRPNDGVSADPALASALAPLTSEHPPSLRRRLFELVLAGLVVAVLATSYGAFAVVAVRSVRSENGALPAADFYTAGANPWALPSQSPASLEPRLALRGPQAAATP
jgi:hypothetical protein